MQRITFIRVVKVMKAFVLNDSVKSFLCLNNKLPQEIRGFLILNY